MKVLDLTLPTPAENLACDEALLDAAEAGEAGEVLRFWESPEHFVVVGYANKVAHEVSVAACEERGLPILRRCSGGGTVVQGPGCLNYALVLRITSDGPTRTISAANQFIMERNRSALAKLYSALHTPHSTVEIQGHTDLAIAGRKFSGNSQRRRKQYLLFHGTFLLNFDVALVSAVLKMPSLQPDYRNHRSHHDFLAGLGISAAAIKAGLAHAWEVVSPMPDFPRERIAALSREKYATREWNWKF
jgi:lipoate-protein ligase A